MGARATNAEEFHRCSAWGLGEEDYTQNRQLLHGWLYGHTACRRGVFSVVALFFQWAMNCSGVMAVAVLGKGAV
jgi:hypothetical protein